ncbi:MAG: SpoIID/LytB domain-containing protein [Rhodothermales bacterium]
MPQLVARIWATSLLLAALVATPATAQPTPFDSVQVRLLKSALPRTIVVSGSQGLDLFSANEPNAIARLKPNEKLTITTSGSRLYFKLRDAGGIYAIRLRLIQPDDGELTIELAEAQSKPTRDHIYKGLMKVEVDPTRAATVKMVNQVAIEDYVESVLSSEFGFEELEASKAMAICIRTLSWRSLLQHGPEYELPDHDIWQVYHGVSPITRTAREATRRTEGQVMTYGGELIEAVYHSSSGGYTANHEEVWDAQLVLPYLRGKRDPYDAISPYSDWTIELPKKELLQALSEDNDMKVTGIRVDGIGRDRRVKNVLLLQSNGDPRSIRSNAFRLTVNRRFGKDKLRSTLFTVDSKADSYVFTGKGFGHGVGLSQYGALEMSKQGHLYNEILAYYFEGVTVGQPSGYEELVAGNAGNANVPTAQAMGFPREESPSKPEVVEEAPPIQIDFELPAPAESAKKTSRRRIGW